MTPEQLKELEGLLERIEDAGGPVEEHRDSGDEGYWWIYYRLTTEEDEHATAGAIRLDEERWLEDSAKLIGALKSDIQARGTHGYVEVVRGVQAEVRFDIEDTVTKVSATHEGLAIAWCLAWLAAFEVPG